MRIQLEGCAIRSWRPEDAPSVVHHLNNRNVWSTLTDRIPFPYGLPDAVGFIEYSLRAVPETSFAIEIGREAAGAAGIVLQTQENRCWAETGYWIGQAYWGRGIATRVLRAMTEYAFENHDIVRIQAHVFEGNVASMRVLEKCGYVCEGMLRSSTMKAGKVMNQFLYATFR